MLVQKDSKLINSLEFEEIEINCDKHGKKIAKVMKLNGYRTEPLCPFCNAEKLEEEKKIANEIQAREDEIKKKRRVELALLNSMIPLRFQQHSFETFIEKNTEQAKRKQRCKEYAEKFFEVSKNGMSMVFCGTTGTGKTHLACSIANYIIQNHDKTAVFFNVIDAVRRVKETYRKNSIETEREAIKWFLQPDLLILDEVGVQFGSDTEKMILFEIINKRYENLKPTILLSNLSPENLKDFVGERIMDRMKEGGGRILTFNWSSFRQS